MKGLKIILIPIILFIFVFAILFAYLVMPKNDSIRESNFPNFSMTDLRGNSVDQDFFFLDEYKVLNVWETYLLNKDNTIIQKHIGIVNSEIWDKKFKELIK